MNQKTNVIIRPYEATDFAALCSLVAEFFTYHQKLAGRGPMPPEEAAAMIPVDMLRPNCTVLVAEPSGGNDIIGFCRYELHEGAYFLRELMVTETKRLRGVGTALLRAAEDQIQEAGETGLYLSITPRNSSALRFFVGRGYDILNMVELRSQAPKERVQRTPIHFLGLQFRY